jgi:endonuclease/exonuclease/phosphatase family metal-dependent hydrolase
MRKRKSLLVILLVSLNLLLAVCLFLAYAAGYISPGKFWILAFFGLAYPVFLLLNLFFVLIWLVTWKRYIFISLFTLLAGWNNLRTVYPFRFSSPNQSVGEKIKVVSFNVHSLYGNQRGDKISETRSKVTEFLAADNADIICIQEFYAIGEDFNKTLDKFTKAIKLQHFFFKNYQEFFNKQKINAIATFSRYPIVRTGTYKLPDKSLYAIFTDVLINGDTIRIYNLHLESIRFGDEDYSFYSHLTDPGKETTPLDVGSKKMMWKLKKAFIFRSTQVESLVRDIAGTPYPVILAGDFNDSPASYTYHQLSRVLSDSYIEAGQDLFGSTYAGKFPSFRIDYVLHSDAFKAISYKKMEVDLSDHYPISSTLTFSK